MTTGRSASALRTLAILTLAALPRIWAAVWDQGIFWPDEIFQSTEQAHRFAFGYGYVSWEFQDGLRSWLFPGVLGLFWKVLALVGFSSGPTLVMAAKLLMAALALASVYASINLGEKLGGPEAAVLCGVLAAVFPPSIVYGSRCMTEMASGPLCLFAVLLALSQTRWKLVLAGCLAATLVYLRYQNGLITLAMLGWMVVERRRDAIPFVAGALAAGLAGGLLDYFTWGAPFHSFIKYIGFHSQVNAAVLGVEPFTYYFEVFWSAVGLSILAIVVGLYGSVGRATGPLLVVVVYVLGHSLVSHKEFRYMMPIVPLMLTLSGVGLVSLLDRVLATSQAAPKKGRGSGKRRAAQRQAAAIEAPSVRSAVWALSAVLVVTMGWRTVNASFDDFGQRQGPLSGPQPLWHAAEDVNRLLWSAGARDDLCGLSLIGYGPIWTGGYTYLHRDVPILWGESNPTRGVTGAAANYVLAPAQVPFPPEYATVDAIGQAKLMRRDGTCAAPPASYTRLFPK